MSRTDCPHYTKAYGERMLNTFTRLKAYHDRVVISVVENRLRIVFDGKVWFEGPMQPCCAVHVREIYEEVYGVTLN